MLGRFKLLGLMYTTSIQYAMHAWPAADLSDYSLVLSAQVKLNEQLHSALCTLHSAFCGACRDYQIYDTTYP